MWARSSVMESLANMPFMPPMGHRWRHHSRRSKNQEHAMAPACDPLNRKSSRCSRCALPPTVRWMLQDYMSAP